MPSTPGHIASRPYTNGHVSPPAAQVTTANSPPQHSDSDLSDAKEPTALERASDADAPGEDYDEDEDMAAPSESSEDVDAEGEPDGDYDSDSPPSEQAHSDRARSSVSQESSRPLKRKASADKDDYITQNPELYGLRRSVRGTHRLAVHKLTAAQGRARPSRRIVSDSLLMKELLLMLHRSIAAMRMVIPTLTSLASDRGLPHVKVCSSVHHLSPALLTLAPSLEPTDPRISISGL